MLLAVLVSVATPLLPATMTTQADASARQFTTDDALRTQEIEEGIRNSDRWIAWLAQAAAEFDIPLVVLRAVMSVESGGDPAYVSPATGATGLMGLRPEIVRGNTGSYGSDPRDPATSIRGAAEFLAHANALFDNWDTAYAAYSGAIGVDRSTPAFRDPAAFGDVARFRWALSRLGYIESPMPRNGTALAWAYEALGAPYVWGGQSLAGFDCSGLVYWAYQQVGVTLPRGSADQWAATTRISAGELRPGDLVFFGADLFHVGLYAGNGMMLHSPREGMTVEIVSLSDAYWSAHLIGYGRVP